MVELLWAMSRGEDADALRLYIQLLGLSHETRQAIRGTLRQISFDDMPDDIKQEEDRLPTLTADALAALIGPCKGLVKLTLPSRDPGLWGCGRTVGGYAPWVDEAFAGHTQLATLRIPTGDSLMAALPRILGHLPGLVDFQLTTCRPCDPTAVLPALALCPCLEAVDWGGLPFDPALLLVPNPPHAPLCARLRRLSLPAASSDEKLALFIRSLARLEQLGLEECDDGTLACVGPHLTQLKVPANKLSPLCAEGFGRLEDIEIMDHPKTPELAIAMLQANRATLRSVSLRRCRLTGSLFEALAACPGLTHLDLSIRLGGCADFNLSEIPQGLLHRLESLRLHEAKFGGHRHHRSPIERPISLASPTLRTLNMDLDLGYYRYPLVLNCPQLRQIAGLAEQDLAECSPMPRLTRVSYAKQPSSYGHLDGSRAVLFDALRTGWPAVTHLDGVRLAQFDDLAILFQAAPALRHLRAKLVVSPGEGSPVLAIDRLESLDLTFTATLGKEYLAGNASMHLRVEAPRLRLLTLSENSPATSVRTLAVHCPALAGLRLLRMRDLTAFTLASSPHSLHIDRCPAMDPACLLACLLGRHGSALRRVLLGGLSTPCRASWPELAAALGALPRLAELRLDNHPAPSLCLACPALRRLELPQNPTTDDLAPPGARWQTTLHSLVLDCPLLEELEAPLGWAMDRFELVGAAANLCQVGRVSSKWVAELEGRWPGANIVK
ncbi:hypothetical protein PAPYR_10246 [Paratrimastix pyriformis]|uniref:Uncharacterized protein n=1 Tax=Paratrimastix pyriformis TaxID=342808 RepID=A0ABQ8U6D7_9EUKA|nr:hypothetical protein PAPYR_10246 [Paratrimastix pyriformis]